jgi:hypothetical protein
MNKYQIFRRAAMRALLVSLATIATVASVIVYFDPQTGRVVSISNTGPLTNAVVVTNMLPPGHPVEWILTNDVIRLMTAEEMLARDLYADYTNRLRIVAEARFKLTNNVELISALNVLLDLINTNRLHMGRPAISDEEFLGFVNDEMEHH